MLGVGNVSAPEHTASFLAEEWQADIRDAKRLEAVMAEARPTAIVHLAAQSSGAFSFEHPVETYSINALGTFSLLEVVRRVVPRARVLVIGTGEVYGPQPEGSRVSEEARFHPVSPYALSKAAADSIAESCAEVWGLDVVRTRSFGHIGAGQMDRFLVPSVARQIAEIEAGRREPILRVGNLDVTRDLTDVRDIVEGYLALLERGRSGQAYNVCRGEGMRLVDLIRSLCEQAKIEVRIEVDPERVRAVDIRYLVGDPTAMTRDTEWRPVTPLRLTLGEVLEEWRSKTATVV